MYKLVISLIGLVSLQISAEIRSVHCPLGCPDLNIQGNDVVFNHTYAISNNPATKFADWVAYEVNIINFGDSPGRNWGNDPLIDDDESLEEDDYKGANKKLKVDRGHLAPLASFAGHRNWSELNYLSNIVPQKSALNQGAWAALEDAVRANVRFREPLYVITGTIYKESMGALPEANEEHQVPSALFKVIYRVNGESVSFIFKQDTARSADFCGHHVSYQMLNESLDFVMPALKSSDDLKRRFGCQ